MLAERFDPQGTLDLIDDEACSVVPVAPPVFAQWRGIDDLAERLGPVRLVLSGLGAARRGDRRGVRRRDGHPRCTRATG